MHDVYPTRRAGHAILQGLYVARERACLVLEGRPPRWNNAPLAPPLPTRAGAAQYGYRR